MIGHPCTRDFLQYIDNNMIPNCLITRTDILAAEDILRPSIASLKGKTVCKGVYVNKLPFLIMNSHHLKFAMVELLANKQEAGQFGQIPDRHHASLWIQPEVAQLVETWQLLDWL
jgi:hypothetical protein